MIVYVGKGEEAERACQVSIQETRPGVIKRWRNYKETQGLQIIDVTHTLFSLYHQSFVVACGIRKVWAKEFKDLDSLTQQISRLKQILSDLGMSGRMSLDQAKSIKAKRELAQELGMHLVPHSPQNFRIQFHL